MKVKKLIAYRKKLFKIFLTTFILSLSVILVFIYIVTHSFIDERIEKTEFSYSEIKQINEFLGFKFDKSQVNRMTFYHARESVFEIFVSDFDSSLVEGNKVGYVNPSYIVTQNSSEYVDGKEYECGRDNLSCFVYEEFGETKAMFIYRDWDADLYKLVKS